jgi:hypothetical protein
LVHFAIHGPNLGPQFVDDFLLLFGEVWILVLLLCIVLAVVVLVKFAPSLIAFILLLKVFGKLLSSAEAVSVAIAVACVHGRAKNLVTSENVVPNVLEDAPRELVVHAGCKQPLAIVLEALDGHLADSLAGNCKLGAAYARDGWRDGRARVYLLPNISPPIDLLGLVEEIKISTGSVHVYPIGTARVVVASYVHVAHACDTLVVEALDDFGGIEAHDHVVVPGVAMGVHEHDGVGEVVVMVDDVAEVHLVLSLVLHASECPERSCTYHSLAPLVLGDLVFGVGVVDLVDD